MSGASFEQHFLLREVALGDRHRPYGTPCVHQHACTRCRFLRVDPAQLGQLEEMTTNAAARLAAARDNVWLGEVAALEESLTHLRRRRAESEARSAHPIVEFGLTSSTRPADTSSRRHPEHHGPQRMP